MGSVPIGRRQALKLLGGAVVLGGCSSSSKDGAAPPTTAFDAAASCALTPSQTAGPFYLDVDSIRRDVREDREGTPLDVAVRVLDRDGCTPVKDAVFEIWHADAAGAYSGFGAGGGGTSSRWLRGAQVTDGDGVATITTIYPGWYPGRAVHIHAKVHLSNTEALTTQLYFDDAVSNEVYAAAPYARRGKPDQPNSRDSIYRRETQMTTGKEADRYVARLNLVLR